MPGTPTYRTRSGSTTQTITLHDIKTLLDNLKSELKLEINKVNDKIEFLLQRANETDAKIDSLEKRCKLLESKQTAKEKDGNFDTEEMLREAEERHKRRKFLIISGIPEQRTGNLEERKKADSQAVQALTDLIGEKEFDPDEVVRVGKIQASRPRLIRIKCKNIDTRNAILKGARNLKSSEDFKNVYINLDQTYIQRKKNKELREELYRRREAGEKVVIYRGRITEQNFL
jgi:hypothetical protein